MNKKILIVTVAVLAILVAGTTTVLAQGGVNAFDALKYLTGMTDDEIFAQRENGVRLGEVARNKNVYDEFHATMLEYKIEIIKDRVADGTLTQSEADAIIENLENCDGTGEGAYMRASVRFI